MLAAIHIRSLELRDRLQAYAKKHGDAPLVEALRQCMLTSHGGFSCPLGALLAEDALETRLRLCVVLAAERSASDTNATPDQSQRGRLNGVDVFRHQHALLKDKADVAKDTRYLHALEACEQAIKTNAACPLHRLLAADTAPPP